MNLRREKTGHGIEERDETNPEQMFLKKRTYLVYEELLHKYTSK